jgi:hypothetical protein
VPSPRKKKPSILHWLNYKTAHPGDTPPNHGPLRKLPTIDALEPLMKLPAKSVRRTNLQCPRQERIGYKAAKSPANAC